MSQELSTLKQIKKLNRDEDIKAMQSVVSNHIPHLTAAALAAALGGTMVLKLTTTETGRVKYVPCSTEEEILQALEWIAEYGNDFFDNQKDGGFFILQQRPPDAKFWDTLTARHLGKIPEASKESNTDKLDLAEVGRRALNRPKEQQDPSIDPIPSSWL